MNILKKILLISLPFYVLNFSNCMEEENEGKFRSLIKRGSKLKEKLISRMVNSHDIDEIDEKRMTPLLRAVLSNDVTLVKKLLKNKANVNYLYSTVEMPDYKKPILHMAVKSSCPKIVKLLIKNGADIKLVDTGNVSSLIEAVRRGNNKIFYMLLPKSDINSIGILQETALTEAVKINNLEFAKSLLDAGSYVDVGGYGYTALDLVAKKGSVEMKKLFEEYKNQGLLKYSPKDDSKNSEIELQVIDTTTSILRSAWTWQHLYVILITCIILNLERNLLI